MSKVPLYAGVDYHQNQLQLCVMDQAANVRLNRPCPNDAAAVASLLRGLGDVRAVAIEACCGAASFGQALATSAGWRVELAHPGYVARLKQSPDKTDYSDARLLADLTRVGYLPRVWLAPQAVRDLRQLCGHRQRLVDRRRALKLQAGAILREQRVKIDQLSRWSMAWIAAARDHQQLSSHARWIVGQLLDEITHVSKQIQSVEQRLAEATADDPLVKKLRTIEGVGAVTSWMLRAWIGRFDRFKNGKQLSRYCELSPRNVSRLRRAQSSRGERQADAGLIDAANKQLRAVLIQAGHRLLRTDARWSQLGERLLRKGKPQSVVVAAVANRWVRSMHHRLVAVQD